VIPEGAGINFLSGRWNPTSYDLFLPHELNAPGVEERLIEEIRRNRVEGILLIDRHVGAYGFIGPGIDYAKDLMTYIRNNYEQEKAFGANPYPLFKQPNGQVVRGPEGGAILFKRKE
jgi:hypothetical protein